MEKEDQMDENIDELLSRLDIVLDSKRKRHIVGGILLSMSLLFNGLAITVITIKEEVILSE